MPEQPKGTLLDALDKAWIKKSIELQRHALNRAMIKEVPGSEIANIRKKEIEYLTGLISRL